jgi:hypothetical protein
MCGQLTTQLFDRQDGVASRPQLLAVGVTARVIDHRLAIGRYRRVHRNVYALGPLSMRGRLVAALLAGGDDAALCHASALIPYRLRTFVATVDVAVCRRRTDEPQLRFHRLVLTDSEVTRRDGLRVTTIGAPALRKIAGEPHTRSDLERRFLHFLADNGLPPGLLLARVQTHSRGTRTR